MNPNYRPFELRTPNTQYKRALQKILKHGVVMKHPHQNTARRVLPTLGPMFFKLSNGFPIITERKISFWKKPIGELLGFIHGVRDANELAEKWGVNWWRDQWATPEKCAQFGLEYPDMGPGSYGGVFQYQTPDGVVFNQWKHVIQQIKEQPYRSDHRVVAWIPHLCLSHSELQRQVVVAPCHGDVQITILGNRLYLRMDQRSVDFPIGEPSNIIQYAALTIMIAHVTGYEPYMFTLSPHDSQIYVDQEDYVREIVRRKTLPFPSVYLTEEGLAVKDLFDFKPDHFELRDYHPNPAITGIPVTT
jgi:thymidylate synthase